MSSPAHDEKKKGRRCEYSSLFCFQVFCYQYDNQEQSHPPWHSWHAKARTFWHPQWSWKGIRGTVRLKCVFFSLSSLPLRPGCLNRRSMQCPVQCVTDASSLCVPPALREMTLIGNRACLSVMHFWWKVLQLPIPQIITKLELIAINSTNIH